MARRLRGSVEAAAWPLLGGLIFGLMTRASALSLRQCSSALGMQSGAIPDSALSASSSYELGHVGPQYARLNQERGYGAWCPREQVGSKPSEYLQIDLGGYHVITGVATQGRFANGQGSEFARRFHLQYQREDDGNWIDYKNHEGVKALQGNVNTFSAKKNSVHSIVARRLRFLPVSLFRRTVCMRVELYGCPYTEGLLSYETPRGSRFSSSVYLDDVTYDGHVNNSYVSDGLGKLADGMNGDSRIGAQYWVGWNRDSLGQQYVDIVFKFEQVRNFTAIRIFCNNMFSKKVRIFKKAEVFFSVDGTSFSSDVVSFSYYRDTLIEFARIVIIPIRDRLGREVKTRLYFDDRWLVISEVTFRSTIAVGNFTSDTVATTEKPKIENNNGTSESANANDSDVIRELVRALKVDQNQTLQTLSLLEDQMARNRRKVDQLQKLLFKQKRRDDD